jgi:hypothetical protein
LGNPAWLVEINFSQLLVDSESVQHNVVFGTESGVSCQWYLGHGFAACLHLGAPLLQLRLDLDWYPTEFLRLTVGFDPLRGYSYWTWRFYF